MAIFHSYVSLSEVKRIQPFDGDMVEGYNANTTDDIRMEVPNVSFGKIGSESVWYTSYPLYPPLLPTFNGGDPSLNQPVVGLRHRPLWFWSQITTGWLAEGLRTCLVGAPFLKNMSQWEGLSQILWKIENVPNHQPVIQIDQVNCGSWTSFSLVLLLLRSCPIPGKCWKNWTKSSTGSPSYKFFCHGFSEDLPQL